MPQSQQVTGPPQSLPMTQSSSRQNPPAQIPYSSGFQGGYPPYGNSTADGQQNRHQGQDTASPPNNPSVPFAAQPAPTYPRSTPGSQPQGYSNAPYASVSEGKLHLPVRNEVTLLIRSRRSRDFRMISQDPRYTLPTVAVTSLGACMQRRKAACTALIRPLTQTRGGDHTTCLILRSTSLCTQHRYESTRGSPKR
jgi:hypothetical protein